MKFIVLFGLFMIEPTIFILVVGAVVGAKLYDAVKGETA